MELCEAISARAWGWEDRCWSSAFWARCRWSGRAVRSALGGPRPRAVLALLVLEAGRVVPAERLAEEVWRGSPPPGAAKTLRSYVSRLRALLARMPRWWRAAAGMCSASVLTWWTRSGSSGWPGRGRRRWSRGRRLRRRAGSGRRWGCGGARRWPTCVEVEPLAREAARLEELRLVAVEGRIEADVELGLHAEVTGELEGLVAEYPLRERLWRLLVLALYRCGRQADALAAYRRARDGAGRRAGAGAGRGAAPAGAGGAAAGGPGGGAARAA